MDWPVGKVREPRFLELGPFPPPVDNHLSLEAFAAGEGLMVGDRVTLSRGLLPAVEGAVVGLKAPDLSTRRMSDRFAILGALVAVSGKERYVRPGRLRLAERPRAYRRYWKAWCAEHATFFEALVESDPLRPDTEAEASRPAEVTHSDAGVSFRGGRDLAYSGLDDGLARSLFRRTVVQADHLLEGLRRNPLPAGAADAARAMRRDGELELRRLRCFAAALLGQGFDSESLRDSARHWAEDCAAVPPSHWDDQHKMKHLRAATWATIAGDLDAARELMASKRSFRSHQDHKRLLSKMLRQAVSPQEDPELLGLCRAFFDLLRHPRVERNRNTYGARMTAFEWGVLMVKLIDRPGEEIDWRAVVDAVSL